MTPFCRISSPRSDRPQPKSPTASCHQLPHFGCGPRPLFSPLIMQLVMKNSRCCVCPPAASWGFFPSRVCSPRPQRQLKSEYHMAGVVMSFKLRLMLPLWPLFEVGFARGCYHFTSSVQRRKFLGCPKPVPVPGPLLQRANGSLRTPAAVSCPKCGMERCTGQIKQYRARLE